MGQMIRLGKPNSGPAQTADTGEVQTADTGEVHATCGYVRIIICMCIVCVYVRVCNRGYTKVTFVLSFNTFDLNLDRRKERFSKGQL